MGCVEGVLQGRAHRFHPDSLPDATAAGVKDVSRGHHSALLAQRDVGKFGRIKYPHDELMGPVVTLGQRIGDVVAELVVPESGKYMHNQCAANY